MSYSFNNDGSRKFMATPAGSFGYTYNTIGQVTGLTNPFSQSFGFAYQSNGWLNGQNLDNKVSVSYTRDGVVRLTDLTNRLVSGNSVLSEFGSMAYDSAGNRTGMTVSSAGTYPYTGSVSYACAASQPGNYPTNTDKDQLVSETSGRAGAAYTNTFGYDAVGNVTAFKGTTGVGYNPANEISALAYDPNGNPAKGGPSAINLTWDANDQAIAFGSSLTAGYDVFGRRAWKQGGAGRTYFVYDEQASVPVCELSSTGAVTATNTWGAAGLLSRYSTGTKVLYTFDPQGSATQRINGSSGVVLSNQVADAYGTQNIAVSGDPYSGFGGQWGYYKDSETGLHLLGARYYDTSTGRFLNRDPSGYGGGINLFSYCGNNPLRGIDPSGLQSSSQTGPPSPTDAVANALQNELGGNNPVNSYEHAGITHEDEELAGMAMEGQAGGGGTEECQGEPASLGGSPEQAEAPGQDNGTPTLDQALTSSGGGQGEFSISDWSGYPEGGQRPSGPFRLLEGDEYTQARKAANTANKLLHQENEELKGYQLHEWHPVKFGGDPVDIANKHPFTQAQHSPYTNFWNKIQRGIQQ